MNLSIPIERGDVLGSNYRHARVLFRKDNIKTISLRISGPLKDVQQYKIYQKK